MVTVKARNANEAVSWQTQTEGPTPCAGCKSMSNWPPKRPMSQTYGAKSPTRASAFRASGTTPKQACTTTASAITIPMSGGLFIRIRLGCWGAITFISMHRILWIGLIHWDGGKASRAGQMVDLAGARILISHLSQKIPDMATARITLIALHFTSL